MRYAGYDLDPPRVEFNDEDGVVRDQAAERPHFGREEVRGHERSPVRSQKRVPRGRPLAARWNAFGLQDRGDCRPRNAMTQILQRTLNACVAPAGILAGHPYHEAADLPEHARASRLPPRVCPFLGNELPVPSEDRVGRDDGRHLRQKSTPARLRLQNPIFGSEVLRSLLLLCTEPTATAKISCSGI